MQIDVLKEIGCIDEDLVVQIKGRVACEMNSGEELICTECLFENQLDDLEPEEAVAIMSAFVFQQKNTSEPHLTPKLSEAKQRLYSLFLPSFVLYIYGNLSLVFIDTVNNLGSKLVSRLHNTALRLGELQAYFKLQIDPLEYARENLKFGLVEVVYEWAKVFFLQTLCNLVAALIYGLSSYTHLCGRVHHLQISVSLQMFLRV